MAHNRILKECTFYYAEHIEKIKKSLTPVVLSRIINLNSTDDSFRENLMIYTKLGIISRLNYENFENYNFYVELLYHPGEETLKAIKMGIKNHVIYYNELKHNPEISKPSRGRSKNTLTPVADVKVINKDLIEALANKCECPTHNIFIIPYYYITTFNEFDTLISEIYKNKKRNVKHR